MTDVSRRPRSTYRLQIRKQFDLDDATAVVGYLRDLGVSWAYLSPLLKATSGSDHGYDVVDPTQVDPDRGGPDGLERFSAAAHGAGLGILADIVPNHTGTAEPAENPWWWDVLLRGRDSEYASMFDIDWDFGGGRVRVPILGDEVDDVIAAGDIEVDPAARDDAPFGVARYFETTLPLAEGTAPDAATTDAETVRQVIDRQHWELQFWRHEADDLNYRRFFAVTTLAGVRVELPWVFEKTHAEVLRWLREGLVDGLRIDHPDGLADPGGYLRELAETAGHPYVVVEKILEHGEALPDWWDTDGTTGYDAMADIDRVLVDPAGEQVLDALDAVLRAESAVPIEHSYADLTHETKRRAADELQHPEIKRLVRVLHAEHADVEIPDAEDALAELLANYPVYRSYLPAGREHLDQAAAEASARRPDLAPAIAELVPLIADAGTEFSRRFMQTTGPVMAKGVEDTAFYRWSELGSLTEVGGDPAVFSLTAEEFHTAQAARQAAWPLTLTALSTHDTKRSEDTRARLSVISELPERWTATLQRLRAIASTGHGPFDALLWQAIVGVWPAAEQRLKDYAEKAAREASERTGYTDPNERFENRVAAVVDAAFHPEAGAIVQDFVDLVSPYGWSNSLSAKLLQLAGPGVPDVYQGTELWDFSLVDPDNRREVDFAARAQDLAALDEDVARGVLPPVGPEGLAKLLVVSRTLRLRRDHPELFSRYLPVTVAGEAAEHAVAFDRGGVIGVATRLPVGLEARGGWGDTVLLKNPSTVTDAFTGRRFEGVEVRLADLLSVYPVALLVTDGVL